MGVVGTRVAVVMAVVVVVAGGCAGQAASGEPEAEPVSAVASTTPTPAHGVGCTDGTPPQEPTAPAGRLRPARPPRLTLEHPGRPAGPAREALRTLRGAVVGAASDTQSGPCARVVIRRWATGGASSLLFAEHRHFRGEDGSGRQIAGPLLTPSGEETHSVTTFGAGGVKVLPDEPLSSEPSIVAVQLRAIQPPQAGPHYVFRAIADVQEWRVPSLAVRRALLDVLVNTDGVHLRGWAVDMHGRRGLAVSMDQADNRELLVLDQGTGEVLVYEGRVRGRSGQWRIFEHSVYAERGYVAAPEV